MISSTSNLPVLENLCDYSPWEIPLSSGLAGSNVSEDFFFFIYIYEKHRTSAVTILMFCVLFPFLK